MATYYWVGGSGTWDTTSTTNWSASSGGAGGAGVPNSADTAILDAASGAVTVTLGENVACSVLTCTTFTGTLDFVTFNISLSGASILFAQSTTMTVTGTPVINIVGNIASTRQLNNSNITEANAISFNVTAGTGSFLHNNLAGIKNLDFTGFTGNWSLNSGTIYGNLILSVGMSLSAGTVTRTFGATSGTQQITTNGKTLDFPITQNNPGATLQLQDNLTMGSTRTFTLTAGTLDLVDKTLSTGLFSSNNSNVRTLAFGTGNITLTQNGTSIWRTDTSTGLTITGTPTVNLTYAGATGTRTITAGSTAGGSEAVAINLNVAAATDTVNLSVGSHIKNLTFTGFTGTAGVGYVAWGNLTLSASMTISGSANGPIFSTTSGTTTITTNGVTFDRAISFVGVGGTFAFQDALTQGSTRAFTITNGTVQLKNGVTSTVGSFVANNSNVKFLQSTTPGSQATLSQASGTVNVVDLTIRDINAVGGASWNAYTDFENVDAGNNDGWNFSLSPPYSTAELPITLRPFTQPRRF
jgi:hypothetical protein